jgi:hypothetical protein
MHEFPDVDANVALNQTHIVDKSAAPAAAEYCSANVCVIPDPFAGLTASAATGVAVLAVPPDGVPELPDGVPEPPDVVDVLAIDDTVHAPRVCQPLFTPAPLAAYM